MDFVRCGIEIVEQTLRVKRAAGSGDGDKNLQTFQLIDDRLANDGVAAKVRNTLLAFVGSDFN